MAKAVILFAAYTGMRPGELFALEWSDIDFEARSARPSVYIDETESELSGPAEPVGEHGVQSYRTIDDAVCKALGIPLAPD